MGLLRLQTGPLRLLEHLQVQRTRLEVQRNCLLMQRTLFWMFSLLFYDFLIVFCITYILEIFKMVQQTRNYSFSDAELALFTSNLVGYITRDQADFTPRGVTALMVTALQTLGNAFELIPTDDYYLSDVLVAVQTKDGHRNDCTLKLRAIMGYAKIKWGSFAPQVKKFGAGDMTVEADKSFLVTCRQGVKAATEYLTDLTPVGLTDAIIDDLEAAAQLFEDDLNDISAAQATRDIKTVDRIAKGNALYEYVAKYCEIGKIIWTDVNFAKYNDYVIYGPNGLRTVLLAPANFVYDNVALKFTWTAIGNANLYEIQSSSNSVDWTSLWIGTTPEHDYVPVAGTSVQYRCRGINDGGEGPFCEPIVVLFTEPLPPPASLSANTDNLNAPDIYVDCTWGAVTGATFYKVFESVVNLGLPAGTYSDIGNFTSLTLRKLGVRNRRYYYKVRACAAGVSSGDSSVVYVDVPL